MALGLIAPALGSPAGAQQWNAFAAQRARCAEGAAPQDCRAALELSHSLKTWAEKRKIWRCYTALLAAEALMLSRSFRPAPSLGASGPDPELPQACGS